MHTAKPLIQCAQWSWHRLFPEYALGLERVGCQVDRYTLRRDNDFDLDECFLDLSDDGISMKGFLRDHRSLFILKAFTKSYGMPVCAWGTDCVPIMTCLQQCLKQHSLGMYPYWHRPLVWLHYGNSSS